MPTHSLIEPQVSVSHNSRIGNQVWVRRGSVVSRSTLGDGTFVGIASALRSCRVGKWCQIASGVCIDGTSKRVELADEVWIGSRAIIRAGVTIGRQAIVAAGANVCQDVPAGMIAMGDPATCVPRDDMVDDGPPDITGILNMILRNRAPYAENMRPHPSKLKIDATTFFDADVEGGPAEIMNNSFIVGRSHRPHPNGGIKLGRNVKIEEECVMEGGGGIEIGADTKIEAGVYMLSNTHDYAHRSLPWKIAPIKIGEKVNVGHDSLIVGPISIGDGAMIEPYSLVLRDVPEGTLTSGRIRVRPAPMRLLNKGVSSVNLSEVE